MFKKLVPVNRERHADTMIRAIDGFGFAANVHLASLMVHEFTRAASVYPIVFVEDKQRDGFRPVVLLGLSEGSNLFVTEQGRWQAAYIPAVIRRYPFALARTGEDDRFAVCIDEESTLVVHTGSEGQRLFDQAGEPTEVVERVKRYLGELQQMERFTEEFCAFVASHNLFTPLSMRVRERRTVKSITGCYVVNEERLNNLSDPVYLSLRERRYAAAIYAHLTSLAQIERLSMLTDGGLGPDQHPSDLAEGASSEASVH